MKETFLKALRIFGIDGAIAYSSLARIITAAGGFLTIFIIALSLSKVEQGYYYTFGSILALQIFFELGLGGIIVQYVAYEAAKIKVNDNKQLEGPQYNLSRLSSLFNLFIRWYGVISILFFIAVAIGGILFFRHNSQNADISWESPWIMLCLFTAINLMISPIIAFIEGMGQVKSIAKMRFIATSLSLMCGWTALLGGAGLYAPAIRTISSLAISIYFVLRIHRHLITGIWHQPKEECISYRKEIFPYQWRIALSWMSGYFIFQLFNPVLFAYCGASVAGQMGMTLTALNGIFSLVLSWTSTKVPMWSKYISLKDYPVLDASVSSTLRQSSLVCFICLCMFWGFLYALDIMHIGLAARFIPLTLAILLGSTIFINNIINIWATYLRCHKKEPFLIQAVIVGICCAISTILGAKFFGLDGVVDGYTSIVVFISLPLSYYIFRIKKREYQISI